MTGRGLRQKQIDAFVRGNQIEERASFSYMSVSPPTETPNTTLTFSSRGLTQAFVDRFVRGHHETTLDTKKTLGKNVTAAAAAVADEGSSDT